jgi:SsrA-binding protein
MSSKEKPKAPIKTIGLNKKASHDYTLEERIEAGVVLEGWEVKSVRAGKIQLVDSYILLKNGEAWLLGTQIPPLSTTSKQTPVDPQRTRKLLLHQRQIDRLIGATEREGYTIVPTKMYFNQGRVKLEIAVAKGKKQHDKRASEKERDWQREKGRLMKNK